MQKKNAPRKAADPDKIHAEYGKDGVFICYDYPTWENIFLSSGVGIRMNAPNKKSAGLTNMRQNLSRKVGVRSSD